MSEKTIHSVCLSGADKHDTNAFGELWSSGKYSGITIVIADKGYDCAFIRHKIESSGRAALIPSRKSSLNPVRLDKKLYKTRSYIERFFGRLKENKRLSLRFDKLDHMFSSFFYLAALKVLKLLC